MTDLPPSQPGNYPPPPDDYPEPGNYPPPPPGNFPPPGNYPPPPPGNYPPPPPANFPPPPPGYYQAPVYAPVGQLPTQAYASWLTRVAAFLIDSLPILLIRSIPAMIAASTMHKECITTSEGYGCTTMPSGAGMILMFLGWLAAVGYAVWNFGYRQGTTGSSIGKSVLKFKVVSEQTGQPIGFGMSVVRQLAHLVDYLTFCVGYLFPLWDAKRQTLADKIMTTVCLPTR
ncbi:RDD family protein [[Mycobacterium] crassicus]|uniref:RDD family protein n=1 Tax=[Mycobacterium] crassicus TaxID=2872309 RepID=A0ABU5XG23_9MYCO|nr:RDD family protein [Mycolicibacter sp. MYC098]MEB3021232.1 RDD family protein [Mycolicibacter sp. MYC098]